RSQATEIVNEVSVCPTLSCSEGDPGQPGQENRRNRWSKISPTCRSTCSGRSHSPQPHDREETKAAQTRLVLLSRHLTPCRAFVRVKNRCPIPTEGASEPCESTEFNSTTNVIFPL